MQESAKSTASKVTTDNITSLYILFFRVLNFLQKIHYVDFHHLYTVFTHFFMLSIININYYSHWQFIPVKRVWKWPRSGFRMSPVATSQVPVGISLPRQKIFAWKYNCQIRHNKLHYKIFFLAQTPKRNLNLTQVNIKLPIQKRITVPKVKIKSQINLKKFQMSQLNAQAQKANQTKRQLSLALQSAQITNANINFNFNLFNHLSLFCNLKRIVK